VGTEVENEVRKATAGVEIGLTDSIADSKGKRAKERNGDMDWKVGRKCLCDPYSR